jgi:5'(3')-deoxyribonucleotidase
MGIRVQDVAGDAVHNRRGCEYERVRDWKDVQTERKRCTKGK